MRLENKMRKWFIFILKSLPLLLLLSPIFTIFTKISVGTYDSFQSFIDAFISSFASIIDNTYIDDMFYSDVFVYFNTFFTENIFNIGGPWFGDYFTNVILIIFEYWLLIDFIDLVFSAFRFILDICRSWLDGFYSRSKRGGK